tara:strand:- start:21560 stop:22303 length:744 start_codon:yes stop_codon:yes gene_type:complete
MQYQPNEELLNILKDKRVAIVGPSPHLIGRNIGDLIDSYDIVCRVNEVHATGYEADYGDRTDIIFHNCGGAFIDIFGERLVAKSIISKYLKFVVCPCVKNNGADNNWASWPDDYESQVVANFKKVNIFNIPFHWIGMKNYKQVYGIYGVEPNAGQVAILMLLEHGVKELFVTGFSFYQQGDMPANSHRPGHTNRGREQVAVGNLSHPQGPQIQAFKQTVLKNYEDRIILDSYLNALLQCEHSNVVEI